MSTDLKKPVITDVMSNWLFAEPHNGSKKRPSLRIKVLGNVPRITVKTNVEGDKEYGNIHFKTDAPTFFAFIAKGLDMAKGLDDSEGYRFEYKDRFLNGKLLDKAFTQAVLMIARDSKDGRMYMAVLSGDKARPRIKFYFGPSTYHAVSKHDGSELTPKQISEIFAIGFLETISKLVPQLLINRFDPEAKNVPKGNFQDNSKPNSMDNSSDNDVEMDYDDDIPY